MKHLRKRHGLTVASAVIGTAALALGAVALPASATELENGVVLHIGGTDKYELAADLNGMTADELRQLEAAGTIRITDDGFLFFIDVASELPAPSFQRLALAPEGAAIPGTPAEGSRPGAPVTLAIAFDGVTMTGQKWNLEAAADPLVLQGASGLSDELKHEVWARVAELYAPFNVNVITGAQPDDVMRKSSPSDNIYGALAVVTDSAPAAVNAPDGLAGVAWMGGAGSGFLESALMFASTYAGASDDVMARAIAETIAHEVGHNFGLDHHGFAIEPTIDDEYYAPTSGLWGPVMGISDFAPVSQWSDGSYAHATNPDQGDLETFTDRSSARNFVTAFKLADGTDFDLSTGACATREIGPEGLQPGDELFTLNAAGNCSPPGEPITVHWTFTDRADMAADTVGNTLADATGLDNAAGHFSAAGVVLTGEDRDMYSVTTNGGGFSVILDVADLGPSLNARLTLFDAAGTEVAVSEPTPQRASAFVVTDMGASIDAQLDAGRYYLSVEGVGSGDPSLATQTDAGGFSDYASVGNYLLSGAASAFSPVAPVTIQQPSGGIEVPGGKPLQITGQAAPGATVQVALNGTVVVVAIADAAGAWSAEITAIATGAMQIVATQIVSGISVAETANLTLQAIAEVPEGGSDGGGNAGGSDGSGGSGGAGGKTDANTTGAKGLSNTGDPIEALPFAAAALLLMVAGAAVITTQRRRSVK